MGPALANSIVRENAIEALILARNLSRAGDDATDLQEAALAALSPEPQPKRQTMTLSDNLLPISRESAGDILDILDSIEELLGSTPYRDGKTIDARIKTARDIITELFPGGFSEDRCEGCDLPLGIDEIVATDYENGVHLCPRCAPSPEEIAAQQADLRQTDPDNANLPHE